MTVLQIANQEIFKLPLERNDKDFTEFVGNFLNSYVDLLKNADGDGSNELKENNYLIVESTRCLKESINEFFVGNIPQSYNLFSEAVEMLKHLLFMPDPYVTVIYDNKSENAAKEYFFKARVAYGKPLSKKEMFIRPFDQREKIQTYRYSIPGLPCLYLSNSIYLLWYELGCPDINSLQVSMFEISKEIKRLPFSWDINFYKALSKSVNSSAPELEYLIKYLSFFPIHALCNIKVKSKRSVFKPEYIFPQFLMQWISSQKIGGIEYLSTQLDFAQFENTLSITNFKNLAVPAKSTKATGYCDILKSKIKLSEPISWQNLHTSFPSLQIPKTPNSYEPNFQRITRKSQKIELIKNQKVFYDETVFGIMENYLIENMEVDYIRD